MNGGTEDSRKFGTAVSYTALACNASRLAEYKTNTSGCRLELAATLRGSRPGMQSASLIMTSLMTS